MGGFVRIKEMPVHLRPRERLMEVGPDALTPAELTAILLRTGWKGGSALEVASDLFQRFGSLNLLARASVEDLCQVKGIGPDKAVGLSAAFALARRLANELQAEGFLLDTPERVADLLREENRRYEVETFQAVLVNTRRRLVRVVRLSQGTLDTLLVHPREVFRAAISHGAAAIILAHNHPSGDPSPSEADIKVTRDLIRAGQLLKIEVMDHVIMGMATTSRPKDYVSLREMGYFYG